MSVRSLVAILVCLVAFTAVARADDDTQKKEDARNHFEIGLTHFDREEYSAALAEFIESRKLFPTRSATKNAAICLRKEKRFDESLEMFESLLRDFPNLPAGDRELAEREIGELKRSVGTVEVRGAPKGATIVLGGRARGEAPFGAPLSVSAGSHTVQAYKEGFTSFEGRVNVAGQSATAIDIRMFPLERSGRLRVTESHGQSLEVVVDNVTVGKTPWEGPLSVGTHVVLLRGDGDVGTQPTELPVKEHETAVLNLVAAPLDAAARIDPTPASATVAIDGVTVGRGVWEGKLRSGSHRLEVSAEGFLASTSTLVLEKKQRRVIPIVLDRDASSPLWAGAPRAHFAIEVAGGPITGLAIAGDVGSCAKPCGAPLPLGMAIAVRPGYQLPSGIAFHLDAGFFYVSQNAFGRQATVSPVGKAANAGTTDDAIQTYAATAGLAVAYRIGARPIFGFRLGAGVLFGGTGDHRTGTFTNTLGQSYMVDVRDTRPTTYFYLAPEIRAGVRFAKRFEVSAGVQGMFLAGIEGVRWGGGSKAPTVIAGPSPERGDGLAEFPKETLLGSTMFILAPNAALRVDL